MCATSRVVALLVASAAVIGCGPKLPPPGGAGGTAEGGATPVLPVVPAAPPPPAFTPAGGWQTTETLILSAEDAKALVEKTLRVSPDGRRWAYGRRTGSTPGTTKLCWVIDGTEYKYTGIGEFAFSDDGKHTLHSGWTGADEVFLDGQPTPSPGGKVLRGPKHQLGFTRDGKHFGYVVGGKLVVDGKLTADVPENPLPLVHRGATEFAWMWGVFPGVKVTVNGKDISAPGGVWGFQFARSGTTHAFITREREKGEWVVVNGEPHKPMTGILKSGSVFQDDGVQLSDDGDHVLYAGTSGGRWYAVHDQVWHELSAEPTRPLTLSPDGRRWACRVLTKPGGTAGAVWVDGRKGKDYASVCGVEDRTPWPEPLGETLPPAVAFSPDGRQVAHAAERVVTDETAADYGQRYAFVVRDGVAQNEFPWVSGRPVFSPNGKHLAYLTSDRRDGTGDRFLTVDGAAVGNAFPTYHPAGPLPKFSPDSRSVGFMTKRGDRYFTVLDGEEQPAYDRIAPEGTRAGFTPDNTYTFVGIRDGAYYWVVARRK